MKKIIFINRKIKKIPKNRGFFYLLHFSGLCSDFLSHLLSFTPEQCLHLHGLLSDFDMFFPFGLLSFIFVRTVTILHCDAQSDNTCVFPKKRLYFYVT